MDSKKRWYTGMLSTEDWWAVWIGLFFVLLGLFAAASGIDSTGWIVKLKLFGKILTIFLTKPLKKDLLY